jgi:hypothetical protein
MLKHFSIASLFSHVDYLQVRTVACIIKILRSLVMPQFGAPLIAVNYTPKVINCAPNVIDFAPREHL